MSEKKEELVTEEKKETINYTEKEKKERFSYTKLDTYSKCPFQFKKKYEEKKRSSVSSLAMDIGSILHKGKEIIANSLIADETPDYEYVRKVVLEGYDEETDQKDKHIKGINELAKQYFEDWIARDDKSGMTYDEKLNLYFEHIKSMEEDTKWRPIAAELQFEFPYRNYLLYGYIDKVEQNKNGDLRVTDYKSSRKTYREQDLKTPLQMFIYALAVKEIYKKLPSEFMYDFILLNEQQLACSKGYDTRGLKKLNGLFDAIEESRKTGIYPPKPSPLCYWCDYCNNNPKADKLYKSECPYYSLWTPNNKTYKVNKPFNPDEKVEKKKFVF